MTYRNALFLLYLSVMLAITFLQHCCPEKFYHKVSCLTEPSSGTCGSIAELAFFDSDTTLIDGGIPISCPIVSHDVADKAFDGDWLSNFETDEENPDEAWVGMDFGRQKSVSYVRVVPRSDYNDICPDNEYELKWWNDNTSEWVSLGVRTATDNVLHYRDIPSGALLWISDLTRGWDERPFLIDDDGKVTWL